jgi:transposase-like protein
VKQKNTVNREGSIFMSKREKVTVEERIEAARACAEGKTSYTETAKRLGLARSTVREWTERFMAQGALGFKKLEHNQVYDKELKLSAVREYLEGSGRVEVVAAKYGLRSTYQLKDWIRVYNSGKDFERSMSGGSRMKTPRSTTQEERIAIAKECLENGGNYGETAIKHNVSYQQVYAWTRKFAELGEAGLEDRRGKRTARQAPRTETEELRIRLAKTEHELYMVGMERDLLKKAEELERGDAFRK